MARYKVIVAFQGTAALNIEAEGLMQVRQQIKELTMSDLAQVGRTDVLTLHTGAREIVAMSDSESDEESAIAKPRPSGWHRPL